MKGGKIMKNKIKRPCGTWTPDQVQAWQAGFVFGLKGEKKPFNPKNIKHWHFGFEAAMEERRRQEAELCL